MHIEQGGKPRPRWGGERRRQESGYRRRIERRRRQVNLKIREHIVLATTAIPGAKPDRVYSYRTGRRLPADRYIRTLEQLQDLGVSTQAIAPQLDAIKDHLEQREAVLRDMAA